MAGLSAVEAILQRKANVHIAIWGDEPHPNYNRILLSDVLAGKLSPDCTILNPLSWYAEHQIDLHLNCPIVEIDAAEQVVRDASGARTTYDTLILATGGLPFIPPIPGHNLNGVHVFRTWDETEALIAAARTTRYAVVIGGGLLGLEAARGLINYGVAVSVVHLMDRLMEQQLDATAGAVLKREMECMGIQFFLNAQTSAILGASAPDADQVARVRLASGQVLPADRVLITTGIRPNTDLAKRTGIACKRGILVDDRMQTDIQNIFAIGDVIEHRGVTYGLIAPLREQAAVLADALVGEDKRRYEGTVCATTLKVAGIHLTSAGEIVPQAGAEEIAHLDTESAIYKKCVLRQGRLTGFILFGDNKDGARMFGLLQRGEDVSAMKMQLLGQQPAQGGAAPAVSGVWAMSDADLICNCNAVTKGTILCVIKEKGCKSRAEVAEQTQATTGCGSCAQWVDDLLAGEKKALPPVTATHAPQTEQKATSLKTLDLEKVKQAGLGIDFTRLKETGTRALEPEDYYRLKTYGFCSQKHAGYFMLRVRIPGGKLNAKQLATLADLSDRYGRGWAHLTVRQNLELHFVRVEDALEISESLREIGLTTRSACGHTMRNVVACPHGGIDPEGLVDVQPWAAAITDYFVRRSDLINPTMPNRLNIYFAACPSCAPDAVINDIAFVATHNVKTSEIGFELWLGGSLGAHPMLGFKQRDFIPLADCLPACQALFAIHTRFGNRNKARSRLKFLIEQWGREKFAETFERFFEEKKQLPENRLVPLPLTPHSQWADEPPPSRFRRSLNWFDFQNPPEGVIPQKQKGYMRLHVKVPLGEIRASQLRAIAQISRRWGNRHVHFTSDQNIELHWIPTHAVSSLKKKLQQVGLALLSRTDGPRILACPGTEFCVLAVTHSQGAAKAILQASSFTGKKRELLDTLSIHISGCPNSCAKHQICDIGLAGTLLPIGDMRLFSYQLFLGGTHEGAIGLGEMIRKGITEEMVVPTVDALLNVVLAHHNRGETFQETVQRLSPRKVAALLDVELAPFVPEDISPLLMSVSEEISVSVEEHALLAETV